MSIDKRFEKVSISKTFRNIIDIFNLRTKKVIDLGCGYGEYLKLFGEGSIGLTTTKEEVEFGREHGINIVFGNVEKIDSIISDQSFDFIWANNLFEHLRAPHAFLVKLKIISNSNTRVILGVPVLPKIVNLISTRSFRGVLATNHINFFTWYSLKLTVERSGWIVEEARPFFFKNRILDILFRPFAPHIYIVAKNDPEFKYAPKKLKEWNTDPMYEDLLKITHQK